MKKFALFAVLALSAVFALAQSDAPTVDETIAALQGGLTSIPVDAAVANIEGWETQLSGSDNPALQNIGSQLGELSTALQADTIDSNAVGQLLCNIGDETTAVAGDDAQLAELGNLLTQAGVSVMGGSGGMDTMSGGMMSGGMMSGGMMSGGGM